MFSVKQKRYIGEFFLETAAEWHHRLAESSSTIYHNIEISQEIRDSKKENVAVYRFYYFMYSILFAFFSNNSSFLIF